MPALLSSEEVLALWVKWLGAVGCVDQHGTCADGHWVLAAARDLQKLFKATLAGEQVVVQ